MPGTDKAQPASPASKLVDFGAVKTPTEAQKLLTDLMQNLRASGFPVAGVNSDAQLRNAVQAFQKQEGLPPTGNLDKATLQKLADKGMLQTSDQAQPLPPKNEDAATFQPGGKAGVGRADNSFQLAPKRSFDPALSGRQLGDATAGAVGGAPVEQKPVHQVETEQAKARNDLNRSAPQVDLKSLLASMRLQGFLGTGKGAEQMKDAIQKLQQSEQLPVTGTLTGATADAMVRRGLIDEATAKVLQQVDPTYQAASSANTDDTARTQAMLAQQEATERGAVSGNIDAQAGRGDDGGNAGGQGTMGGGGSTQQAGEGQAGVVDQGDPGGDSNDVGNSHAGDDDDKDERRGRANQDELEQMEDGAWRCAPLSAQVERLLLTIGRNHDEGHGAATYTWDVELLRPGIYGRQQPAPVLFHLAVQRATAFDDVWHEAIEAINAKLRAYEPDARELTWGDVSAMLRRARYSTPQSG
jgi:hypothetical protein